jgi:hypothetical protein
MQNENYYKAELESKMQEFLDDNPDNDFGWLGDNITSLMTDAAFAVLKSSKDVQEYLSREGIKL